MAARGFAPAREASLTRTVPAGGLAEVLAGSGGTLLTVAVGEILVQLALSPVTPAAPCCRRSSVAGCTTAPARR